MELLGVRLIGVNAETGRKLLLTVALLIAIVRERGVRELKDDITRDVLTRFDEAGIAIASATFEVAAIPTLREQQVSGQ